MEIEGIEGYLPFSHAAFGMGTKEETWMKRWESVERNLTYRRKRWKGRCERPKLD